MKITSPLFDRIRVKPAADRRPRAGGPVCDWKGCECEAAHRAPKGGQRENEYWRFCLDHVREYNASFNFFAGMTDDAVTKFQKDALTGHRPTWKVGAGRADGQPLPDSAQDPFGVFREIGGGRSRRARAKPEPEPEPERRTIRNAERKALDVMGLDIEASAVEVKARFKLLVKRHHPDANGGDRAYEEKLREIITAYNYLKSVGFG